MCIHVVSLYLHTHVRVLMIVCVFKNVHVYTHIIYVYIYTYMRVLTICLSRQVFMWELFSHLDGLRCDFRKIQNEIQNIVEARLTVCVCMCVYVRVCV